jgi:hypothetical protein
MLEILKFLNDYAGLIYLLLLLGAIFAFRQLAQARNEQRQALFGLEKQLANQRLAWAVTSLSFLGILALAEFVVIVFLVPSLPFLPFAPTPTLPLNVIPTSTIPPEILQMLETGTPVPTLPSESSGCIPAQITITSPKAGETVRGVVTLTGSADIPNFGFYKYEFSPVGTELWTTVQAGNQPVQDGRLGSWDTSELTPGDYLLRLVVTDNQGQALPPCVVPVRVLAP